MLTLLSFECRRFISDHHIDQDDPPTMNHMQHRQQLTLNRLNECKFQSNYQMENQTCLGITQESVHIVHQASIIMIKADFYRCPLSRSLETFGRTHKYFHAQSCSSPLALHGQTRATSSHEKSIPKSHFLPPTFA